jgi:hypothetical protein
VSATGIPATYRSLKTVEQKESHARLSKDLSRSSGPPLRSTRARLDAIIVPASRPAAHLQPTIELAAFLGAFLVVLCSLQAKVEQVAVRVARTPGARALVVHLPRGWTHLKFPTRTSSDEFKKANANRESDLSA